MQSRNRREGIRSQDFAKALLGKVCFLAQPSTIADDIGIDYFCTLFSQKAKKYDRDLVPKINFCIQIKSKGDQNRIDLKKQASTLGTLTHPYFLGIMDKRRQVLEIYSGHYLTLLFSLRGSDKIKKLKVETCTHESISGTDYSFFDEPAPREFVIRFPLVAAITENIDHSNIHQITNALEGASAIMSQNIASAVLGEHFFISHSGRGTFIHAGQGSLPLFEANLFKTLTIGFFNLNHANSVLANKEEVFRRFAIFEKVYFDLEGYYGKSDLFTSLVTPQYRAAKKAITQQE